MIKLSKEILIKISEYDNTFNLILKELLNEFYKKTSFWKINKFSIIYGIDKNFPFVLNYHEINDIIKNNNLNYENSDSYSPFFFGYNKFFYSGEFISDNNKVNLVSLINN
jgi:hypothetical protein